MPFLEVLCPNGRKVKVSVTPNTTMQQVLEEACTAQSFVAGSHYLRHNRKPLDLSLSFRFSNLTNMAKLELLPLAEVSTCDTISTSSSGPVRVALQFSTSNGQGHRVVLPEVDPHSSLWSVLEMSEQQPIDSAQKFLHPEDPNMAPMVIFLNQKIAGEESLKSCTLHGLGVLGGSSALLKYAQVAQSEVVALNSTPLAQPRVHVPVTVPASPVPTSIAPRDMEPMDITPAVPSERDPREEWPATSIFAAPKSKSMFMQDDDEARQRQKSMQMQQNKTKTLGEMLGLSLDDVGQSSRDNNHPGEFANFKFPDAPMPASADDNVAGDEAAPVERQAIWFHLDSVPAVNSGEPEEYPDEVYEVTEADVRSMVASYRELLEEKPLMTEAYRQTQREKRFSKYSHCVLHFHFANRLVLQAAFHPRETLRRVSDFLKQNLLQGVSVAEIYVTPPRRVFKESDFKSTLLQLDLVPLAKMYVNLKETNDFDVLNNHISLSTYEEAAKIIRQCFPSKSAGSQSSEAHQPLTAEGANNTSTSTTATAGMPKWMKGGQGRK